MIREVLLISAAVLAGLAWGHPGMSWLMATAAAVPLLWHLARSRCTAGAVALGYYLAGSRSLPFSAGIFFDATAPAWLGWALWVAAASINAALWFALWQRDPRRRAWCAIVVLVLTAIPPIGIIGWLNPITSAGFFFPGLGFIGLLFIVGMMFASMQRCWRGVAVMIAGSLVANFCAVVWPAAGLDAWSGLDTHFPKLQTASADLLGESTRVMHVMRLAHEMPADHVLVLPETVLPQLGAASSFTQSLLDGVSKELQDKRSVILVGAELHQPGGQLKNVLAVLGQGEGTALHQRMPVPIGMWKPWSKVSVDANMFGSGIGYVAGQRVAYSICYEQLLIFPVLLSMAHSPTVLVGAANDWWARDTSVPTIQGHVLDAWGRLFAVPVVKAINI